MLRKKTSGVARRPQSSSFIGKVAEKVVDRRSFLRGSGLAIGGIAATSALIGSNVKPVEAAVGGAAPEIKKTVCTHCSVGCTVMAEVNNGVYRRASICCHSYQALLLQSSTATSLCCAIRQSMAGNS